jgi:uncharacterized protein (DUF433 family)
MNSESRAILLATLAQLCRRYPDWRFGQLVANVAGWAGKEIGDVEDDDLLTAARSHLQQLGSSGPEGEEEMSTLFWQHLERNPRSAYKQLFIKGTRIRAEVIYGMTVDGSETRTPEGVAQDMNLPLEAVREAIAYCEANPQVIAEDHRREEAIMEATGMNDPDYKFGGRYKMLSPQERARLRL